MLLPIFIPDGAFQKDFGPVWKKKFIASRKAFSFRALWSLPARFPIKRRKLWMSDTKKSFNKRMRIKKTFSFRVFFHIKIK